MLADAFTTAGAYVAAFVVAGLLLFVAVHVYAAWTIRNIDQTDEA